MAFMIRSRLYRLRLSMITKTESRISLCPSEWEDVTVFQVLNQDSYLKDTF
jgi:hypothetical protein